MKIEMKNPCSKSHGVEWKDLTPGLWQSTREEYQYGIILVTDDNLRMFIDAHTIESADSAWESDVFEKYDEKITLYN